MLRYKYLFHRLQMQGILGCRNFKSISVQSGLLMEVLCFWPFYQLAGLCIYQRLQALFIKPDRTESPKRGTSEDLQEERGYP